MRKPRIAVILDENTSGDGTRYEAAKGYFKGVRDAGGLPFGIPYLPEIVHVVLENSRLAAIIGEQTIMVNTFHREAVAQLAPSVVASAHAGDGIIEAIEIPAHRFAIGI